MDTGHAKAVPHADGGLVQLRLLANDQSEADPVEALRLVHPAMAQSPATPPDIA